MARIRWAVRCHAHRTNGQPCGAWSISGGYVCTAHGGRIGQVKAAAQRRLMAWKADRRMQRTLGRPLNEFERSRITGDDTGWRREVNGLLLELKADLATEGC
jgi:hypothetical protein